MSAICLRDRIGMLLKSSQILMVVTLLTIDSLTLQIFLLRLIRDLRRSNWLMLHLGYTAISVTLVLVQAMLFLAPALCEAIDLIQQ